MQIEHVPQSTPESIPQIEQLEVTPATCGRYYKLICEINKVSHAEFGRLIGISHGSVSNWIAGNNMPSLDNINRTAVVLKIPAWQVLMSIQLGLEPPNFSQTIDTKMAFESLLATRSPTEIQEVYKTFPKGSGIKLIQLISYLEAQSFPS